MKLDFTALGKALQSLAEAVESVEDKTFMAMLTDAQRRTMRAGVIQSFEFSYELSWKMLRRQLLQDEGESEVAPLSRKDLYRLGARKQLLENPEAWFVFHRARNETSLTYDEAKAQAVYVVTLTFLGEARALLLNLTSVQGDD